MTDYIKALMVKLDAGTITTAEIMLLRDAASEAGLLCV